MKDELIKESLEDEAEFSSTTHAIDTITKDVNIQGIQDYHIPERYNKLQLVLLPVNKEKYYFYWDFPEYFLHENIVAIKDISFHIVDENHDLFANIQCDHEFGQYFYKLEKEAKFIKVIAVYKHGVQYKNLIESNTVKVFNTQIKYDTKDVWIEKRGGFTEVIRASLNHFTLGMSSKSYVEEIKRLEEYSKMSTTVGSSSNVFGGK